MRAQQLRKTSIDTRTNDNGGRLISDAYDNGIYHNSVTDTRSYNTDNTLAAISYNKSIGNVTYTWVIQRSRSKVSPPAESSPNSPWSVAP